MAFTESELLALFVPLGVLPGLDAGGLHLRVRAEIEPEGWEASGRCASVGGNELPTDWVRLHNEREHYPRSRSFLNLWGTTEADQVARWAAKRVEIPSSCGVIWHPGFSSCADGSGWILYGTDGEDSSEWFVDGEHEQSPLRMVNPDDGRRLPDGSRYVDRLALALWVVTLAGRAS